MFRKLCRRAGNDVGLLAVMIYEPQQTALNWSIEVNDSEIVVTGL